MNAIYASLLLILGISQVQAAIPEAALQQVLSNNHNRKLLVTPAGNRTWSTAFTIARPLAFVKGFSAYESTIWTAGGVANCFDKTALNISIDGGKKWRAANANVPFKNGFQPYLSSILATSSQSAVAVGKGAQPTILTTKDAGKSWKATYFPDDSTLFGIRDVSLAPNTKGTVLWASGLAGGGKIQAKVLRSLDGGLTWKEIPVPYVPLVGDADQTIITSIVAKSAEVAWVAGNVGNRTLGQWVTKTGFLYKTRNGGKTWARKSIPDSRGLQIDSLAVSEDNVIIGGHKDNYDGYLASSSDGATSFTVQKTPAGDLLYGLDITFQDEKRVWASCGTHFMTSKDSGKTWKTQTVEQATKGVFTSGYFLTFVNRKQAYFMAFDKGLVTVVGQYKES